MISGAVLIRWLKFAIPALSGLVLVVDAATIGKWNSFFNGYGGYYYGGGLGPNNALLAACIFNILYFCAALWFLFKRPDSIFISVLVDTCVLGFLFLFNIGCVGSVTSLASAWNGWYGTGDNSLGALLAVTTAFGWVLVIAIGLLLGLEVYITIKNHGTDMQTWKTPMHRLMEGGGPIRGQPAMAEEGKLAHAQSGVSEYQQAPTGYGQQPAQAAYQAPTTA